MDKHTGVVLQREGNLSATVTQRPAHKLPVSPFNPICDLPRGDNKLLQTCFRNARATMLANVKARKFLLQAPPNL